MWRIKSFFHKLKLQFFPPKPLLSPEQHKELILKSRRNDAIADEVCKLLKCKPDEMLQRITKVEQSIGEMSGILRTAHVGKLIDKVHLDCKKHAGSVCKQCDKCLNNECEKCLAVDWLRNELGLPSLLNINKH